jgi:hypothetical protein
MTYRFCQHFKISTTLHTVNKCSVYLQVYEIYSQRDSGTRSVSFKSKEEWYQTVPKCDTHLTTITVVVWCVSLWGEYQCNTDMLFLVSRLWRVLFAKHTCTKFKYIHENEIHSSAWMQIGVMSIRNLFCRVKIGKYMHKAFQTTLYIYIYIYETDVQLLQLKYLV